MRARLLLALSLTCILGVLGLAACAEPRTCAPPAGVSGSPRSIEEAVALINALPKPTSVACFVESLDRPLQLVATGGTISAQPAQGRRSPRIFLFSGPLVMSVVPEGPGASLLEFGEQTEGARSLKGEIAFPVEAPVEPEAPYARVMLDTRMTSCVLCHDDERPAKQVGTAWSYTSGALQPADSERVPIEELRTEAETCDAAAEPGRCALLAALFFHGKVQPGAFAAGVPTLFK